MQEYGLQTHHVDSTLKRRGNSFDLYFRDIWEYADQRKPVFPQFLNSD